MKTDWLTIMLLLVALAIAIVFLCIVVWSSHQASTALKVGFEHQLGALGRNLAVS
jgi:hypothetical protein